MLQKKITRSILCMGVLAFMIICMPKMQVEASGGQLHIDENTGIKYGLMDFGAIVQNGRELKGDVEIPPNIEVEDTSYDVVQILDFAFGGNSDIHSIIIPDSVTNICLGAFMDCTNLKSVLILGEISSLGNQIFLNCNSLETITVISDDMKTNMEEQIAPYNEDKKIQVIVKSTSNDPKPSTNSKPSITKTNTYIPPVWKPTEPGDIFRHSLVGTEEVDYTVLESTDSIYMKKEVQGQLFFDAVALIQGDYTLGRTYTIFVNDKLTYQTENKTKIALNIPEALQKEGREFCMFRVSENGAVSSLPDLDADPTTISFETDKFYAFVLGYKD